MSKVQINYDKWQNKTKRKAKRRSPSNSPGSMMRDINNGWNYFWSRRKANPYGGGM